MENEHLFYPDFDHPGSKLSAFTLCIDLYIISLNDGEIICFKPADIMHFGECLRKHSVRDITVDNSMPNNHTTPTAHEPRNKFFNFNKRDIKNE